MKTKVLFQIRLDVEVESTRKVKVKAHTRVVNGKTVKVPRIIETSEGCPVIVNGL